MKVYTDYNNNYWESPKTIEFITGATRSTIIEITRKTRHGEEVPPFLSSPWAPNCKYLQELGSGETRQYYLTEILFISLFELAKPTGISKEIISLFLLYFQHYIENDSLEIGNQIKVPLNQLAKGNGLINLPSFKPSRYIQKPTNPKYTKPIYENIEWVLEILTTASGKSYGKINVLRNIIEAGKKKPIDSDLYLSIPFSITNCLKEIDNIRKTFPPLETFDDNSDSIVTDFKFKLNPILGHINERIEQLAYKKLKKAPR